jgi:dTDP-4-amino-4,6-dideoxygalactose transaminase
LPDPQSARELLAHLQQRDIQAVFHYVPLHISPMGKQFGYREGDLPVTELLSACLVRLPLFYGITPEQQGRVVHEIRQFFIGRRTNVKTTNAGGTP